MKNKILILGIFLVFFLNMFLVSSQSLSCSSNRSIGDIDGDGVITSKDSELILGVVNGIHTFVGDICCADLNKDGKIGTLDANKVNRIVAGLENSPGKCPMDRCYDSDGGLNYYEKGISWGMMAYNNSFINDTDYCVETSGDDDIRVSSCFSGNLCYVRDYYCVSDSHLGSSPYTCPNGCVDGACVNVKESINNTSCYDSDGGLNYYEKGVRTSPEGVYADYCKNGTAISEPITDSPGPYLAELYCDSDNTPKSEFYLCPKGCVDGTCIKISPTNKPVDIPKDIDLEDKISICQGCVLNDTCYPISYRKSGKFCSDDGSFIEQREKDSICENNFECSSNVCISGKCIDEGFIQKIINWFTKLFTRN